MKTISHTNPSIGTPWIRNVCVISPLIKKNNNSNLNLPCHAAVKAAQLNFILVILARKSAEVLFVFQKTEIS